MRIVKRLAVCLLFLSPLLSFGKPDVPRVDDRPEKLQPLTCLWRGVYSYGQNAPLSDVKFNLILIQSGSTLVGFIKEPNTFGKRREPWLHAVLKGKFEEETGKVTFTKTYDGTGGESHDVEYKGDLAKDGKKIEGTWSIGGVGDAGFVLERLPLTRSGLYSGVYEGSYEYPAKDKREPVKFYLLLVHDGKKVVGCMKEVNTFGRDTEPWLQASFKGTIDEKGELDATKTYDGTAGEDHDVEYSGRFSRDRTNAEGTWNIRTELNGSFRLKKLRLDDKTLESIK